MGWGKDEGHDVTAANCLPTLEWVAHPPNPQVSFITPSLVIMVLTLSPTRNHRLHKVKTMSELLPRCPTNCFGYKISLLELLNEVPLTEWLKQQNLTTPQFWRLQVPNQDVSRARLPLKSVKTLLASC
jgi:hypothetical protein